MSNEVLELEDSFAGMHIATACGNAAKMAEETGKAVHFVFNETHVTAQPGESPTVLQARWDADREAAHKAWVESPEYAEREAKRAMEAKAALEAHLIEPAKTEAEMREAKVPWPLTPTQLAEYVDSLVTRGQDYGTCVYAMSMAAVAAFNYAAHVVGATGFQASCADLDIIRRTRSIAGPFMLIQAEDALYPQYDLPGKLAKALDEWEPWLKEQAEKKLAEPHDHVHPNVLAHWQSLAGVTPPSSPTSAAADSAAPAPPAPLESEPQDRADSANTPD